MYCSDRHTAASWAIFHASSLAVRVFLLLVLPALVMVRVPCVAAQTTPLAGTSASPEAPPLSGAQEQARRLATALTGKRESAVIVEKASPLGIPADQTRRLGQRMVIRLFVWRHVDVRLVGGEQTFVSPVDEASITAPEDAGRPVFRPASQAAVAVEVLAE